MMLISALFPALAVAHFTIQYPGSRGFDEDKHGNWPCGGFNTATVGNRSNFPVSGGPIQIYSTHTQQLLQVLIAVGNEPGDSFNDVVVPTFTETGPQDFCFGQVTLPPSLNLSAGDNATLQIISSGGGESALYACVDITLTAEALSSSNYDKNCKNSTGVSVSALANDNINANETSSTTGGLSAASSTATLPSSTSTGLAAVVTVAPWVLPAIGVIAGLLLP